MKDLGEQLRAIAPDRVREQEPMRKYTNFRIGGPARFFVEVRSEEEVRQILAVAHAAQMSVCVLGGGSNMLVSDKGFDGIVLKMALREIRLSEHEFHVDAGVPMILLARKAADAGLTGLEWAITLPGTVGGAVRGNAGCFGGETSDYLVEATILSEGEVVVRKKSELQFAYRESIIKHTSDVVLSAKFRLVPGEISEIRARMEANLTKRKASQPLDAGSAGCMFKNVQIASAEEVQRIQLIVDLPSEVITSRRLSAGWVIDQLDLKGFQIGGARISERHGNFLLNTGDATADDVVQLIAFIKTRARNTFGIHLQEEVQYVGF